MRVALDTNVLAYSEGLERVAADRPKIATSHTLISALAARGQGWIAPVQTFAELHNVLVARARVAPKEASSRVRRLMALAEHVPTTSAVLDAAFDLASLSGLRIFDAIILAAAAVARCDLLASEDLQDGFGWRGVKVTNPFGLRPDPRLAELVGGKP